MTQIHNPINSISPPKDLPHYVNEKILLVNDSGFDWIPNDSIDAIITDPPFNIARDTNFHTYEKNTINSYRFDGDKGWDSYSKDDFILQLHSWSKSFQRVLRPGGSFAIFCADEYLSHLITALNAAKLKPRRTLTWYKPNAVPINRSVMMMSACEYVVLGVKGSKSTFNANVRASDQMLRAEVESTLLADKAVNVLAQILRQALKEEASNPNSTPREMGAIVENVIRNAAPEIRKRIEKMYREDEQGPVLEGCVPNFVLFNSKTGKRRHPTEKPVQLLRYLLALISNESDLLLDPFAGSSSLGEAAEALGRYAILVEKDPEFFSIGSQRMVDLERNSINFSN